MMTGGQRHKTMAVTTATIFAISFAALVPCVGRAADPPGETLFKGNNCVTCHTVDHKLVGPSLVDVAKKFAGQPDAVPTLTDAIKKGHVGTWGQVPMPPHPELSDSQIKSIVDWILTLK
jgi:cytochrome c